MKKFLIILGGIFLVIVLVVAGVMTFAMIKGGRLDAESKAYAESIISPLLSNFTSDNFIKYVAEENRSKIDRASLDKLASEIRSHWGQYKSYDDLKGDSIINMSPSGELIYARYVAKVHYEKESPSLEIVLTKTNDAWSLVHINLRTDVDFTTGAAQSIDATQNLAPPSQ